MESAGMSTRGYDNTNREEAARQTRRRVLEAARDRFVAHGYAATTITEVARAAGVSPQTVYARFGSKAALLKGVYDITLAGDDQDVPMVQRPEFKRLALAADTDELITSYAALARSVMARLRQMLPLIYGARAVEPDLEELALTAAEERRFGARRFAANAVGRGLLRAGLTEEDVAELVWVLIGPETYLLLVQSSGLDDEGYEAWLARALRTALT
jgi:AcrR family transcriptional regulator